MSVRFTEEQLNNFDKATLIQLFLTLQDQLESIDSKMQLMLEQMADMNRHRFGRSSEKSDIANQISFTLENGEIIFNETEAIAEEFYEDEEPEVVTTTRKKPKGKKEEDIKGLPVEQISHEMSEEELESFFGDESWKRLPDEVYKRYKYTPASVSVEEHHVAVYSGAKSERMVKANHPKQLLRNSLASASTVAGICNAKYVNAMPLYRIEAEYNRAGINISRQTMANWVIQCADRYLAVIYDYQKTRKSDHPREFLKDFQGVCVTDGYQVYHTIESERSEHRQLTVKPLIEAYFAWARKMEPNVLRGSKTYKGIQYSLNQEKYLKVFLEDGEVPMDNNAAEQSIRGFCIGKKNWVMIDTIAGAKSSAIAYSIAETAKANRLKPYEYFKYLLTVIPEHMDDTDRSFLEKLLPWSKDLPDECRKVTK